MANSDVPGSQPSGLGVYGSGAPGFGASPAPVAEPAAPTLSIGDAILYVLVAALLGGVLSVPAALVWDKLADPGTAILTKQGAFLGEVALNQQAEVTLWFLVIGAGFGFVAGLVVGWFGQRRGWITVVAVVVLCAIATALTGYLGMSVFGPDAKAQAATAAIGATIVSDLSLGSKLAYLGWPIGGLVGACVAIFLWPVGANDRG